MNYLVLLLLLLPQMSALALNVATPREAFVRDKVAEQAFEGWIPHLKLSSNYTLNSNNNVVGQANGDSIALGLKLNAGMTYKKLTSEWRNHLKYDVGTNRNPSLPRYVKSADALKLSSLYLYGFENYPSLGPYFSASVESSVFKGEDVQATNKTYVTPTESFYLSSFKTTDSFAPVTTKEALGILYRAIARPMTKLEFRAGLGALQVNAKNQLRVKEVNDTTVTLESLESYSQLGFEYGMVFNGKWNDQADYSLSADFLTPVGRNNMPKMNSPCEDCDEMELTNVEIIALVTTKISDWVSISYEYKAIKKLQLLNKFQIQHGFVFNISHDFFDSPSSP